MGYLGPLVLEMKLASRTADFGPDVTCRTPGTASLPLFVEPKGPALRGSLEEFLVWFEARRDALEAALLIFGAVVFRGFPILGTDDFGRLTENFPEHRQGYAGGASPRSGIKGRVMEATKLEPNFDLPLHQEMAYMRQHPRLLAFFCRVAAETGGGTTIADMRKVSTSLSPELLQKFERLGVRYIRNLLSPDIHDERSNPIYGHMDWKTNFGTDDRGEVEAICRERSLQPEWLPDGSLNMYNDLPGVITHPVTHNLLYFNQGHAQVSDRRVLGDDKWTRLERIYSDQYVRPFNATFGDGSPFSEDELTEIYDAFDTAKIAFPWRPGDVMFVENKLTWWSSPGCTGDIATCRSC